MNNSNKQRVLIIEPSQIVSDGLETLINKSKEFIVSDIVHDLSFYNKNRSLNYDIIIINPIVVSYDDKYNIKNILSVNSNISLVSLNYNIPFDEVQMRQFDSNIGIYDTLEQIIKKLNSVIDVKDNISLNSKSELSTREKEILVAIAKGKANKEIAEELSLSVFTVITHRKNISHKLGINSISGLTVYAIMNNLIDIADF